MSEITGGCLCGAVRFRTLREPFRVGLCHCLTCRKNTGSVFDVSAVYPLDGVEIVGETKAYASSKTHWRHFCPTCGSTIFERDARLDEIDLHVGAFDEPGQVVPTYELWIKRPEPWLPEIPGLARYDENRDSSGHGEEPSR